MTTKRLKSGEQTHKGKRKLEKWRQKVRNTERKKRDTEKNEYEGHTHKRLNKERIE